jgi:hypothetical protein
MPQWSPGKRVRGLVPILVVGATAFACEKNRQEETPSGAPSAPSAPSASAAVDATWKAEIAARKHEISEQLKLRRPRIAKTSFIAFGGVGEKKRAKFRITNQGKKTLEWAQAWVFYYGEDDRYLDRFPHSFEAEIAPGATIEKELGYAGAKIPEGTKTAECEISAVEWNDDTKWSNENLERIKARKRGGLTDAELMKLEGEKVVGKWTGAYGKSQRPVFLLANISGRALATKSIWTFYYAQDGEELDREVDRHTETLAAGASVRVETGKPKPELVKGVRFIEVAVPSVEFTDGNRGSWTNENLTQDERPMSGVDE